MPPKPTQHLNMTVEVEISIFFLFSFKDSPYIDLKRDIGFRSSKRFKFEKIDKNDSRLDGCQYGRSAKKKKKKT